MGSDDLTPFSEHRRIIRCLLTFSRKLVTARGWSLAYIRWYSWSFELPLDILNTWGHPCAERTNQNLVIHQFDQEFILCRVESVLELRDNLVMVKWRLRTCYSWCLTSPRRFWWSEALGELLEFVGAPRRRLVHGVKLAVPEMKKEHF